MSSLSCQICDQQTIESQEAINGWTMSDYQIINTLHTYCMRQSLIQCDKLPNNIYVSNTDFQLIMYSKSQAILQIDPLYFCKISKHLLEIFLIRSSIKSTSHLLYFNLLINTRIAWCPLSSPRKEFLTSQTEKPQEQ